MENKNTNKTEPEKLVPYSEEARARVVRYDKFGMPYDKYGKVVLDELDKVNYPNSL